MGSAKNSTQACMTSQLLNFTRDSYLERTSRPVYAIVFLLPFIVFYEIGTILINTDVLSQTQIRVVAFIWLQRFLEYLGAGSRFAWAAPPLVVIVILVGLQLASCKPWYFVLGDYVPMIVECTLLAIPLIVLSLFFNGPAPKQGDFPQYDGNSPPAMTQVVEVDLGDGRAMPLAAAASQRHSLMADVVTGVGAGIYEELVFRLILICLLMMLIQDVMGASHRNAIILSVLISAALFSAHHHIIFIDGQLGQTSPFNWTAFGFRTLAGVYFAGLFAIRGFGITAGTHAFYDIIATIINAVFFTR